MKVLDLQVAPYNPRIEITPRRAENEKLKASISEFGLVERIVFNQQTNLLSKRIVSTMQM